MADARRWEQGQGHDSPSVASVFCLGLGCSGAQEQGGYEVSLVASSTRILPA